MERLAEAVERLTAWLLLLANDGVQFAGAASESLATVALVRVLGGDASTTVQTGLRGAGVLVGVVFAFASFGFVVVQETLGAEEFVSLAVGGADDEFFTAQKNDDETFEFAFAEDIYRERDDHRTM